MAENVMEDQGTNFSREELRQIIKRWGRDMRIAAANDPASRRELLTLAMASKKVAEEADAVTPDSDPDLYWELRLEVQALKRQIMIRNYLASLEVPDMTPIARERYNADSKKYGGVPERRMTSQILFLCQGGDCDVESTMATANKVLEELQNGADFEELVAQYSQDPGSKSRGGKFDRWIKKGEARVVKPYSKAAFEIEEVGGYSPVTSSKFGFHIIRLDGIEEAYIKDYDELGQGLIDQLELEYRRLAAMEYDQRYGLSNDALFDDEAIEELLAPYRSVEVNTDIDAALQGEPE